MIFNKGIEANQWRKEREPLQQMVMRIMVHAFAKHDPKYISYKQLTQNGLHTNCKM